MEFKSWLENESPDWFYEEGFKDQFRKWAAPALIAAGTFSQSMPAKPEIDLPAKEQVDSNLKQQVIASMKKRFNVSIDENDILLMTPKKAFQAVYGDRWEQAFELAKTKDRFPGIPAFPFRMSSRQAVPDLNKIDTPVPVIRSNPKVLNKRSVGFCSTTEDGLTYCVVNSFDDNNVIHHELIHSVQDITKSFSLTNSNSNQEYDYYWMDESEVGVFISNLKRDYSIRYQHVPRNIKEAGVMFLDFLKNPQQYSKDSQRYMPVIIKAYKKGDLEKLVRFIQRNTLRAL